jgi:hypothetical protein
MSAGMSSVDAGSTTLMGPASVYAMHAVTSTTVPTKRMVHLLTISEPIEARNDVLPDSVGSHCGPRGGRREGTRGNGLREGLPERAVLSMAHPTT